MRDDPTFQKWCDWLKVIEQEVSTLFAHHDIFGTTIEIVQNNQAIDKASPFWGYFIRTYADAMVMGIRRQCKDRKDSISLARLLREIAASPKLVQRSDFESLFREPDPLGIYTRLKQEAFDTYAKPGSPYIDSARVINDLHSLKHTCKAIEEYADRRVAHWDQKDPSFDLSLDTISAALNGLGR